MRPPQLHSATGAYWIDCDRARRYLRQAYLVAGGIGYTLTLSADDAQRRGQHLRAFDSALRSIRIVTIAPRRPRRRRRSSGRRAGRRRAVDARNDRSARPAPGRRAAAAPEGAA